MTENKRFYVDKSPITHLYVPYDKEQEFVFEGVENGSTIMKLVGLLNNALEENEQLKDALNQRTEQCDKYYKENERLHDEIFRLRTMIAYDRTVGDKDE